MRLNATSSQTYHGRAFDFADPRPEMVDLDDIALVMFRLPRFNGHLAREWSLGHHSLLVSALLANESEMVQACGLLHDASEVYTGDMPGPLKRMLGEGYKSLERPIEAAIAARFGVLYPWPGAVKQADLLAQDIEATMMLPNGPLDGGNLVRAGFKLREEHRRLVERIADMESGNFAALVERLCAVPPPCLVARMR